MRRFGLLFLLSVLCVPASALAAPSGTTDADADGFFADDPDPRTLDCNDDATTGPTVFPGAIEVAEDGLDQNCNGWGDELLPATLAACECSAGSKAAGVYAQEIAIASVNANLTFVRVTCEFVAADGYQFLDLNRDGIRQVLDQNLHDAAKYPRSSGVSTRTVDRKVKKAADEVRSEYKAADTALSDRLDAEVRERESLAQESARIERESRSRDARIEREAIEETRLRREEDKRIERQAAADALTALDAANSAASDASDANRVGTSARRIADEANSNSGYFRAGIGGLLIAGQTDVTFDVLNDDDEVETMTARGNTAGGLAINLEWGTTTPLAEVGGFAMLSPIQDESSDGSETGLGLQVGGSGVGCFYGGPACLGGWGAFTLHHAGGDVLGANVTSLGGAGGAELRLRVPIEGPLDVVWVTRAGIGGENWGTRAGATDAVSDGAFFTGMTSIQIGLGANANNIW